MGNPEALVSTEAEKIPNLAVIKLGGSVITYKDNPTPLVRKDTLFTLSQEIKDLTQKGYKLILAHGAGSFGHPLAKKYGLHKGMETEEQKLGYGLTIRSMLELNSLITDRLLKLGVPAVGLPPHAFAYQIGDKLQEFDPGLIRKFLDQGFVPVLFGDVVLDEERGCSILSGDVIVPYLAGVLGAKRVVFLSDVDGVFSSDPKLNTQARRIPTVTNENLDIVLQTFVSSGGGNKSADVTGEMEGKILAIKRNLAGIEVIITSGFSRGNLVRSVQGKNVGTKIFFE